MHVLTHYNGVHNSCISLMICWLLGAAGMQEVLYFLFSPIFWWLPYSSYFLYILDPKTKMPFISLYSQVGFWVEVLQVSSMSWKGQTSCAYSMPSVWGLEQCSILHALKWAKGILQLHLPVGAKGSCWVGGSSFRHYWVGPYLWCLKEMFPWVSQK